MLIEMSDFSLLAKDGTKLERQDAEWVKDLWPIISTLRSRLAEAKLKGKPLLVEIWTPAENQTETQYQKYV